MNHWKYVELQKPSLSVCLRTAATRILGPLDVAVLRDVLEHIVERHESLRTRIIKINGVPYHHIVPWGGELRNLEIERMNEETNAQNCAEAFFQQKNNHTDKPQKKTKQHKQTTTNQEMRL